MFGWISSTAVWGRVIEKLIDIFRKRQREQKEEQYQSESDRIDNNHRAEWERMYDRNDAD